MIARGADVNAEGGQPVDGFLGTTRTPLQLALKRGETPIAQALRKAGARSTASAPSKKLPPAARSSVGTGDDATIAAAIQLALPPLHKTAFDSPVNFQRHASKQACTSCHQQSLPLGAISVARDHRFAVDPSVLGKTVDRTEAFTGLAHEFDLQTLFHPEPASGNGYALWSLHLAGHPASPTTDSAVHQIAVIQHVDGSWPRNLPRPPIQSSDIGATALGLHGLKHYPIPGRQKEFTRRIEHARKWLHKAKPEFTDERAYQLLGLAWAGESPRKLKPLAEALIREQRDDGGWAQLPKLGTDAFATGQALYALMSAARIPATHSAVQKGVQFLLRTQLADGTWYTPRRTFPFQPPMESSFPHGADGWLSASASSWAVLALASAVDSSKLTAAQLAQADSPTAAAIASSPSVSARQLAGASGAIEFTRDIQPVLERSCVACHSGERPKGGYQVTSRTAFLNGGARGEPIVIAGHAASSPLLRFVSDEIEDQEMPPRGKRDKFPPLTKEELARLASWIEQGAEWPKEVIIAPKKN